jgi:hypothetical protein
MIDRTTYYKVRRAAGQRRDIESGVSEASGRYSFYNWRKRSEHIKVALKYIRTSGSQRERNGLGYSEFFTTLDFYSSCIGDMWVTKARAVL